MSSNSVLISVIIPSYNRADTIGQTIDSIVAQEGIGINYDLEIVIGDDCSTDNAREILTQYQERYPDIIRLFFRDENIGLGANWAQCVKDCRGKYICNCDNDDYWHNPQKLQLQLDYMESHPDCNICITDHRTHNRTTGMIRECKAQINRTIPLQRAMWGGSHFCNATIMYRADFMKAHLDLDEFIRRRLSLQDWPTWVILTAYTDIDILPYSTATFGVETESITRPNTYERFEARLNKDKEVCRYLGELFPDTFPYTDLMWEQYQNHQLMMMAYRKHDYTSARRYSKLSSPCLQQKIAKTKFTFDCYCLAKKMKHLMKK